MKTNLSSINPLQYFKVTKQTNKQTNKKPSKTAFWLHRFIWERESYSTSSTLMITACLCYLSYKEILKMHTKICESQLASFSLHQVTLGYTSNTFLSSSEHSLKNTCPFSIPLYWLEHISLSPQTLSQYLGLVPHRDPLKLVFKVLCYVSH